MGTGWRRAFCTSIRGDPDTASPAERQHSPSPSPSPKSCTKLGFFGGSGGGGSGSNPSTPRMQPVVSSSPSLRCRTKSPLPVVVQDSPKLQCKTSPISGSTTNPSCRSPKLLPFQKSSSSNPSSPRSPSRFALLRNSLRLSRSSCGICLESVKTGQGTAIFTAECSHAFHFPCIASHVRKQGCLVCPVCGSAWRQVPLLPVHCHHPESVEQQEDLDQDDEQKQIAVVLKQGKISSSSSPSPTAELKSRKAAEGGKGGVSNAGSGGGGRAYNDDEPLVSPIASGARWFNPIPEADDEQKEEDKEDGRGRGEEFQGFFAANPSPPSSHRVTPEQQRYQLSRGASAGGGVHVTIVPDVALLSTSRSHENYVVALKVKGPPPPAPSAATTMAPLLDPSRRAPIDLVTVLDVGGSMTGAKLHMLKRAMRLVVASLGPTDRLSIVAFSAAAKRLLPLRRMSPEGQRVARRIVDRLAPGQGSCAGDALRKATKVLEDRRVRNPVASIMLLSDGQQQQDEHPHHRAPSRDSGSWRRSPPSVSHVCSSSSTRFAHLEIPVHASGFGDGPQRHSHEPAEDAFAKCVGGLLSVILQDVRLQLVFPSGDICAVYSSGGSPVALGGGGVLFRLGDLYADEERELLVEMRLPLSSSTVRSGGGLDHHVMYVRSCYNDPVTQELVQCRDQPLLVPFPIPISHPLRHSPLLRSSSSSSSSSSSAPKVERLRNLFVTTRAVAEARRLADHNDFVTSFHLLTSARWLLLQSSSISADENLRAVEAELADLQWRSQQRRTDHPEPPSIATAGVEDGTAGDALTPTSAWRAAERLAKLAIMRKSLNRVSDLHGFENARF